MPKKSGKSGKPALTIEERAANKGLSVADYKHHAKINIERRELSNKYVSQNMKSGADKSKVMTGSWKHADTEIRKRYSAAELKKYKIKLKY